MISGPIRRSRTRSERRARSAGADREGAHLDLAVEAGPEAVARPGLDLVQRDLDRIVLEVTAGAVGLTDLGMQDGVGSGFAMAPVVPVEVVGVEAEVGEDDAVGLDGRRSAVLHPIDLLVVTSSGCGYARDVGCDRSSWRDREQ